VVDLMFALFLCLLIFLVRFIVVFGVYFFALMCRYFAFIAALAKFLTIFFGVSSIVLVLLSIVWGG
jgi:hypothetical protein